jgi:hypothetical protein
MYHNINKPVPSHIRMSHMPKNIIGFPISTETCLLNNTIILIVNKK